MRASSTRPLAPISVSRITTPCTRADWAIGGYTGATSFVFVGTLMLPAILTATWVELNDVAPPGGGGGGGGGGAPAGPPNLKPGAPTGPPCASSLVSDPGANASVTADAIGVCGGRLSH